MSHVKLRDDDNSLTIVIDAQTLHCRGVLWNAVQVEAPTFSYDFFEDTIHMTSECQINMESSNLPETISVKRMLSESGSYVESQGMEMRLVIQPPDVNVVVVGLRLLIGSSGHGYAPTEVMLGRRIVHLEEHGDKRWYDLPLTNSEALAMHPSVSLRVFGAVRPQLNARVDCVEVYVKPRSEVTGAGGT
eukprot:scaffold79182_cov51-Prasinocladus_malaysianus.AAC.2